MEKQIENVASWMTNRQRKCFHIVLSAIRALVQAHNVYSIIICSADNIYKLTVFSFAITWYQQIIQQFIPLALFVSTFIDLAFLIIKILR